MVETNITNKEQKDRLLAQMVLFFARCMEPNIYKHYEVKEGISNQCLKSANGLTRKSEPLEMDLKV